MKSSLQKHDKEEEHRTLIVRKFALLAFCTLTAAAFLCLVYVYFVHDFSHSHYAFDIIKIVGILASRRSNSFTIDNTKNVFLRDGKPFQYVSGSIHYSRVPPIYWEDRLKKMKAAGLDAAQIYIPWNFHEAEESEFNFKDDRDVENFIQLAHKIGLLVIVRAGPYVCGEWDFGGLPAWLLRKNATMVLRSADPQFTSNVQLWFDVLLPKLKPLLYENGGPVIMVQLENEYGSYYTCDKAYLGFLYELGRKHLGKNVILFTTDGYSAGYLRCGAMDKRYFATVDFGPGSATNPKATFHDLRSIQKTGPLVNSEYYTGWLDSWGKPHSRVDAVPVAKGIQSLLTYSESVNVNMYMFHGGTNFGYWNGANSPPFAPQPTSYDYDAPISENGDTTNKFFVLRNLIAKIRKTTPSPYPANVTKTAYGTVQLQQTSNVLISLFSHAKLIKSPYPITMEDARQYQGFLGYETSIAMFSFGKLPLVVTRVADIAYVFTSDDDHITLRYKGTLNRTTTKLDIIMEPFQNFLIILVENQGHVNYGRAMFNDVKGIIGNVTLNDTLLTTWTMAKLDLSNIPPYPQFPFPDLPTQASIHIGLLDIKGTPADTFINPTNFSKGQVHINGKNVGRYWPRRGPQVTLYVPKSFLHNGFNLVQIFELENAKCSPGKCTVQFTDKPQLDGPTKGSVQSLLPTYFRRY